MWHSLQRLGDRINLMETDNPAAQQYLEQQLDLIDETQTKIEVEAALGDKLFHDVVQLLLKSVENDDEKT